MCVWFDLQRSETTVKAASPHPLLRHDGIISKELHVYFRFEESLLLPVEGLVGFCTELWFSFSGGVNIINVKEMDDNNFSLEVATNGYNNAK